MPKAEIIRPEKEIPTTFFKEIIAKTLLDIDRYNK